MVCRTVDKIGGEVAPLASNLLGTVTREPLGVVAAVVPWNFSAADGQLEIRPGAGRRQLGDPETFRKSPLTAIRIAALAHETGIPAGVFQVLPGDGEVASC